MEQESISLHENPYAFARVSVMKSKLLKKDDYDKLMKMKTNEFIKFLEETEYKKEVDELAVRHSGMELLELAVNKNLTRTYEKLKRITEEGLKELIQLYLKRNDLWNIKTVLRAIFVKEKTEFLEDVLIPVGSLKKDLLMEMAKQGTVKEALELLAKTKNYKPYASEILALPTENLMEVENWFTVHYYNDVLKVAEVLPEEGTLFRNFLISEISILNLVTLFKLKKEGLPAKEIEKYLIKVETSSLKKRVVELLLNASDMETAFQALEKTRFSDAAKDGFAEYKQNSSLIVFETALYKKLLQDSILLLHQHPLSIDVILGYMFAKSVEGKNLKMIMKGKELGIKDEIIEKEIVI